jgi:hypothetical protein
VHRAITTAAPAPIRPWTISELNWRNRLSIDVEIEAGSHEHVIDLFQEAGMHRHLDVRIWFGGVTAADFDNRPIDLEEVAAEGKRWWNAMYRGDARTSGHGIVPAGPAQ